LEDRLCPSGGHLLVDSFNTNSVPRYDEMTGAFVDEFIKKGTDRQEQYGGSRSRSDPRTRPERRRLGLVHGPDAAR
jgi:hypothetical protein